MNELKSIAPLSLYLHIPKCGGTAITKWLSSDPRVNLMALYSGRNIECSLLEINGSHITFGHINVDSIVERYPNLVFDNGGVFTYATVREPLSRFLSLYHYLIRNNTIPKLSVIDFIRYIERYARPSGVLNSFYISQALPQVYWLNCTSLSDINLIGRIEDLSSFVAAVKSRFGIDTEPQIINAGGELLTQEILDDIASQEFMELFFSYYADDYRALGYTTELSKIIEEIKVSDYAKKN